MAAKLYKIWTTLIDKLEPEVTFELEAIRYSWAHGHEICIMKIAGKNIFPQMTAEEILSNPKAMAGLSKEDLIRITRLDLLIKHQKLKILEVNTNGTILTQDLHGNVKRYSEKLISSDPKLQDKLEGRDAHGVGYRIGLKEGIKVANYKSNYKRVFLNKLAAILPLFKKS